MLSTCHTLVLQSCPVEITVLLSSQTNRVICDCGWASGVGRKQYVRYRLKLTTLFEILTLDDSMFGRIGHGPDNDSSVQ